LGFAIGFYGGNEREQLLAYFTLPAGRVSRNLREADFTTLVE